MRLLRSFADAGFRRIEATSYSHPDLVPAFRDASDLLAAVPRRPGVAYKATCPNARAVERALTDLSAGRGADELSLLSSATESHSERNLRATRKQQWSRIAEMAALADGRFTIVGVISVAFGCPFEGAVDAGRVVEDVSRFAELGASLVTLGDTTGLATPHAVAAMFRRVADEVRNVAAVAHFHDTRGTGIANCVAALDAGCRHFDSSFGGVGGHPARIPYGGGQTGNVCTEDLVDLFEAMGIDTGLDRDGIHRASRLCEQVLGRDLHAKTSHLPSRHEAVAHG